MTADMFWCSVPSALRAGKIWVTVQLVFQREILAISSGVDKRREWCDTINSS
jgi:hypothetical protein